VEVDRFGFELIVLFPFLVDKPWRGIQNEKNFIQLISTKIFESLYQTMIIDEVVIALWSAPRHSAKFEILFFDCRLRGVRGHRFAWFQWNVETGDK